MHEAQPRFLNLAGKTIVAHTLTYVLMGVIASQLLHYATSYAQPNSGMRPFSSPWVMAGPLFQPLRGLIFASVFYPLRGYLFDRRDGWLEMAWMLIALGILSTFAPAGGSLEGLVYTTTPWAAQLRGWIEIVPQALLLSALLCFWVRHPEKRWLSWTLGIVFFVLMGLMTLGVVRMIGRQPMQLGWHTTHVSKPRHGAPG